MRSIISLRIFIILFVVLQSNISFLGNMVDNYNFSGSKNSPPEIIVKGIIKDRISNLPLTQVSIKFFDDFNRIAYEVLTDEYAQFKLKITEGEFKVEVKAEGYFSFNKKIQTNTLKKNYFGEAILVIYMTKNKYKESPRKKTKEKSKLKLPLSENKDVNKESELNSSDVSFSELKNTIKEDSEISDKIENKVSLKASTILQINSSDQQNEEEPEDFYHFKDEDIYTQLEEIKITAQKPQIRVKGDTLLYDVASRNYRNGALLQDVIKNIPGLKIKGDGTLIANGEAVQKIKVDGKEFFGNDIQLALKNLPADMITRLELFRESSNISRITGFKNEKDEQVLNLKIKEEFKSSLFGDILAGYGSEDHYDYKGMANYLGKQNQFSLVANADNKNGTLEDIEASSEEPGEIISKKIGLNTNFEENKTLKIGANIRYSDISNQLKTTKQTTYFDSDQNRNSSSRSLDDDQHKNTAFGINVSHEPKSRFSLYFRLSGEHEDIKSTNNTETFIFLNNTDLNKEISESVLSGNNNEIKSSLTLGWKLNEQGSRALGISISENYSKEENDVYSKSITQYQADNSEIDLDQKSNLNDKKSNTGFLFTYTEPLDEHNSLLLSYAFQNIILNKNKQTFTKDLRGNYTQLDSTYTRYSDIKTQNNTFSINYQNRQEKYEYSAGINAEPFRSENKISIGKRFLQSVNQEDVNYSFNVGFKYKMKKSSIFDINYSGRLLEPGVDQLTTDTITISPTNKIYGNPDLKSTFTNNINFRFRKNNLRKGSFFSVQGGLNFDVNQIAGYTVIDKLGNQESSFRNVNGNWGMNLGSLFNTPIINSDFSLDLSVNASYFRYQGFMNEAKNITNDYIINGELSLNMDFDFLETRLQSSYAFNTTRNNHLQQSDLETSVFRVSNLMRIELPFEIELYNYFGYAYRSGYRSISKKDEVIWNLSLSKKIFPKENGEIRLQFYDLLNRRNNVMRSVNSNYITDLQTNLVKRYFLLSFVYKFNFLKGKKL